MQIESTAVVDEHGMHRLVNAVAIGKTPTDAIKALVIAKGLGDIPNAEVVIDDPIDHSMHMQYTWGLNFTADGTSFKAAGFFGPDKAFAVLTWWK